MFVYMLTYMYLSTSSVCCTLPLTPWNVSSMRASPSLYSPPHPQLLDLCLAHSRCQNNICWMGEARGRKGSLAHPSCPAGDNVLGRTLSPSSSFTHLCGRTAPWDREGCYPTWTVEEAVARRHSRRGMGVQLCLSLWPAAGQLEPRVSGEAIFLSQVCISRHDGFVHPLLGSEASVSS